MQNFKKMRILARRKVTLAILVAVVLVLLGRLNIDMLFGSINGDYNFSAVHRSKIKLVPTAARTDLAVTTEITDDDVAALGAVNCEVGRPCEYAEELDLRIIVMAYDRSKSLKICLEHLQRLELDGASAAIEIWLDRSKSGKVNNATLKVALDFRWTKGLVRVHCHQKHAGIYGQWIDTWRPRANSSEVAIILEDDIDVSPYVYRWTRAAHRHYDWQKNISGYSLSEVDLITHVGVKFKRPMNTPTFAFARAGSFGFSPHPDRWREFQDWFHIHIKVANYKPYVKEDIPFTEWYKQFEDLKTQDSMWTMWFIKFTSIHHLYSIYTNYHNLMSTLNNKTVTNATQFAYHRREKGLHFAEKHIRSSSNYLMNTWSSMFESFPDTTGYFTFTGEKVNNTG